jgi:hypothetical protein
MNLLTVISSFGEHWSYNAFVHPNIFSYFMLLKYLKEWIWLLKGSCDSGASNPFWFLGRCLKILKFWPFFVKT